MAPIGTPPSFSVVVPAYNEEGNVEALYRAVSEQLEGRDFEIVFVDDGSTDGTLEAIRRLIHEGAAVRYLSFSRNFGHQAALRAGLLEATGDAVISMDADLQHPPELIPALISRWEEGYDVVYTVRNDRDARVSWLKRQTSRMFYRCLNFLTDLDIEPGAADFRLLDRKVLNVVNEEREADLFLRGYIQWVGFRQTGIEYMPDERFSGDSKYTLKKMLSFAGSGLTQFSVRPLRLGFILAFAAFFLCLLYIVYAIVIAAQGDAVPGWLSLVTLFVFMQGFQFLLTGLIGEYLGRTFMQTKGRPEFIVAERS